MFVLHSVLSTEIILPCLFLISFNNRTTVTIPVAARAGLKLSMESKFCDVTSKKVDELLDWLFFVDHWRQLNCIFTVIPLTDQFNVTDTTQTAVHARVFQCACVSLGICVYVPRFFQKFVSYQWISYMYVYVVW